MKKIIENNDFQFTGIKIMMLCLCAQLFLPCCLAAIADEPDTTSILDDESSQNDNILIAPVSPNLFDIRTLSKTGIEDFNILQKIAPATNFVAEVKTEHLQNYQSLHIKDKEPKKEDINRSSVVPSPAFVFRPPVSAEQDDIKKIIEQIRSINTGHEMPAKTESPARGQEPNTIEIPKTKLPEMVQEPNTPVPGTGAIDSSKTQIDSSLLSNQILVQVDNLIKDPNRISNPLEFAEILFKSGKIAQAAICYKQALSKTPADDANFADERAWILFQIGNCLKFDDPNAAMESFSQLLNAHPESPWAQAAKTSRDLAEWFQQDEPKKLITELKK
jgi:tetratricopeptide (TPR) repeat protein